MERTKEEQNNSLYRHAMLLAQEAGLEGVISLESINSGGNNRVFMMNIGDKKLLLKSYFHSDDDPRDRLGHEFAFTSFAWEQGVKGVPRPIACDQARFLGLYEFIDGKKIDSKEVTLGHISQALDFFLGLNTHKEKPNAGALPIASEACFSIAEHLSCVDRRLKQLQEIKPSCPIDGKAADFIHDELSPCWEKVREGIVKLSKDLRIVIDEYISVRERCLSPSDFGFHNAILEDTGELRFVDFEYAGWDDPAKMVCDFFCQPAVPVPFDFFQHVMSHVQLCLNNVECFSQRVDLLLPAYRIKWCCIILNDFLLVVNKRRKYAFNNNDRRELQLNKAKKYLEKQSVIIGHC